MRRTSTIAKTGTPSSKAAAELAEARTRIHALQESLRLLVSILDSIGGYSTPEQQAALREARWLVEGKS